MTASEHDLADRIRAVLALDPTAPAVEFQGVWYSWGALASVASELERHLRKATEPGTPVAVVMRNDPATVGAMLGVLLAGSCIVTMNPSQGDEGLAADLTAMSAGVVVALPNDWERPGVRRGAHGSLGLSISVDPSGVEVVDGAEQIGPGPFRTGLDGVAVEMLTSGTTGPPKRVPLTYQALTRSVFAAGAHYSSRGEGELRLSSGVAIVASPFVHMSGLFRVLLNICQGRKIALLDRFRVQEFVDLVLRHRPRAVSLVPTALGMVLDAGVDPSVFDSVEVVTSGTSHLSIDLQERFEKRFGVAVLPSYGATEFAGGVAGWNLQLYREWGARKRGSVGRPQSGREVRVVDAGSGEPLGPGERGLLEVRTGGGEWVRTTDLGLVDADGFVYVVGRADDVIVRGGFKVTPATVAKALRDHSAVRDAGVTGLPDPRLGAVPVAAVELEEGRSATEEELIRFLRNRLMAYQVPTRILIVPSLPRTPSLKISQPALRQLFQDRAGDDASS